MTKPLVVVALFVSAMACSRPAKLRPDVLAATAKLKETVPGAAWSVPLEAPAVDLLEPVGEDALLVGALTWNDKFASFRRGPLQLIEPATGKRRWKIDATAIPNGQSLLVTADPLIVIATITGDATVITGIERETGTVVWSRRFGRRSGYVLSPVLARAAIIIVDDNAVHAVELATGVNRWTSPIPPSNTPLAFSAWLGEPAVYAMTDRVHRLSIDGGRLDWTSGESIDGPITQAVRISDQLITIGSAAITSISTIDGRVTWRHAREGLKPVSIGMAGVNLMVAWTHTTSAIQSELTLHDTSGSLIWHSEPLAELRGGPVIDDDGFIVVTTSGQALRIDARSSAIVARAKLPLELIGKRGLPDFLSFHNRNLHVRREHGVAIIDLATMKVEWSMPVFANRAIEWSTSEKQHNGWLAANGAIPPTTAAVLQTARRAAYDALFETTLASAPGARLAAAEANAASDALHLYLAAQSQAYLDDGRANALFAGANMRNAIRDYFATGATTLTAPVTYRAERNGVLVIDSEKKAAGVVWSGPHVDDEVTLAHLDRKNGLLVTVSQALDPKEHRGYWLRLKPRHTVSLQAFPIKLTELRDTTLANRASAELTGLETAQVEIPRFIVHREGQKLAERYPDHGCPKDYATQEFAAGSLAHYAVHAEDADLLVSLVRNNVSFDKAGSAELTPLELAQQIARPDTVELMKSPRPTKNDAVRTAAAQGDLGEVMRLLNDNADPNAGLIIPGCDFGPLHFAIVKGNPKMVDALLKAGAQVNFLTPEGTALDLAENYKAPKAIFSGLKARGAKPGPVKPKPAQAPAAQQEPPKDQPSK